MLIQIGFVQLLMLLMQWSVLIHPIGIANHVFNNKHKTGIHIICLKQFPFFKHEGKINYLYLHFVKIYQLVNAHDFRGRCGNMPEIACLISIPWSHSYSRSFQRSTSRVSLTYLTSFKFFTKFFFQNFFPKNFFENFFPKIFFRKIFLKKNLISLTLNI